MTLAEAFDIFKSRLELNSSYDDIVQRRHAAVRECIERALPTVRTQLIGSLQRKTRIDPLQGLKGFDVDILAELGAFVVWAHPGQRITCESALEAGEKAIASNLKYRKKGIQEDQPAIIVPYDDGSYVEVVPAYRDRFPDHQPNGRAYYIPHSGHWTLADYDYDAEAISSANKQTNGRVVAAIKMLKAWRRNLVPDLRSYHLEVLALAIVPSVVKAYEAANATLTWAQLLVHFFTLATSRIQEPAIIPGSLSERADYYFTTENRQRIAQIMQTCGEAGKPDLSKTSAQDVALWRKILGEPFPPG
jgi:hypothetical protein